MHRAKSQVRLQANTENQHFQASWDSPQQRRVRLPDLHPHEELVPAKLLRVNRIDRLGHFRVGFFYLNLHTLFHPIDLHNHHFSVIITASSLWQEPPVRLRENIFVDSYPTHQRPNTTMGRAHRSNCRQALME